MSDRRQRLTVLAVVCMVVFGAFTPGLAAAGWGSSTSDGALSAWGGQTTKFTAAQWDDGQFNPSDRVVTHGVGPGVYVKYENDSFDALDTWLNSSSDRVLLEHDVEDNRALIAAPASSIHTSGWFSSGGLAAQSYVEWVELETQQSIVEPVTLDDESAFKQHGPSRSDEFRADLNGGEFTTKGVAYGNDVNTTNMAEVKDTVAATDGTGDDAVPASANGTGSTIAFIDSGLSVPDESARGKVWGNGTAGSELRITAGKNFVTNETINKSAGNYSAISDANGHGTYVAARAAGAARGNDSLSGIASDANIAVAKVFGEDGSGSVQNVIEAVEWASSKDGGNADVISMSLGSQVYSKVLANEIREAYSQTDVSAIIVASGNSRLSPTPTNTRWVQSPGDVDGVITVAATSTGNGTPDSVETAYFSSVGEDGGASDFSSGVTRGERPDLSSPGMSNKVVTVSSSGLVTTSTLSGTSMSTPDVSAAVAVLLERNPTLKGEHTKVRDRVLATASPAKRLGTTETGHGLLNVSNLLEDTRPQLDQEDARTKLAGERDRANLALGGNAWSLFG